VCWLAGVVEPATAQALRAQAIDRGERGEQQADAECDRDGGDDKPGESLPAAAESEPEREADH
jgi:hypothetical protein